MNMDGRVWSMAMLTALLFSMAAIPGAAAQSNTGTSSTLCVLPRPFQQPLNQSSIAYIVSTQANAYSAYACHGYIYHIDLNRSVIIAEVNVSNTINKTVTRNFTVNYTSDAGTIRVPQFNYSYAISLKQVQQLVKCGNTQSLQLFNVSLLEQLIAQLLNYLSGNIGACVYPLSAQTTQ